MGQDLGRIGMRVLVGLLLVLGVAAGAPAAGAESTATVIEALDGEGRLVVPPSDADLDAAIDRANAEGIAFAWLERDDDPVGLADRYVDGLAGLGSRYRTVLVVVDDGYGASSVTHDQARLDEALDAAFDGFNAGAFGRGLDAFTTSLAGGATGASTATTAAPADTGSADGTSGDTSGGFGLVSFLLLLLVAGGGFLLWRGLRSRRKAKRRAELEVAEDRAEIKEQLENNADRVIELGDRVIAKGDRELIELYEEASTAYQDVSQGVDGATTAAEVDALDDRIDRAEWQFEVIEAALEGRPRPPEPRYGDEGDEERPPPPTGGPPAPTIPPPASGGAEPPVATSPRTGRSYPRTTGPRRGGGLGGSLGGLGGILANIVLGGGLGGLGGASRRTQRRSGGPGSGAAGRSGGLGGGVLRRGGSSSRSGRPRTSSGGRSLGRSRSRGGRKL